VIDDGEQKLTELLDELKEAHDEERRMNADITKLRLQLDETQSATDFAKKDAKKLAGTSARSPHFNFFHLLLQLLFLYFLKFLYVTATVFSSIIVGLLIFLDVLF